MDWVKIKKYSQAFYSISKKTSQQGIDGIKRVALTIKHLALTYPKYALAMSLALMILGVWGWFSILLHSAGHRPGDIYFIVKPQGSWSVAQKLEDAHIIPSALFFRIAVAINQDASLKAGEYIISAHHSIADIIKTISKGHSVRYKFTIPEGWTHHQIREALNHNILFTGEIDSIAQEGFLLPETYFIYRYTKRQDMIDQMLNAHNELMTQLWPSRKDNLPITTKKQAVILASIVEKETSINGERAHIAGVFLNRLRKNNYMQLQSDPTVIYALNKGQNFDYVLTYKDLKIDSPYNTYVNYGLPPSPIANPGRKALEAVLNPQQTKNLFFVADGTGGHAFAETYKSHLENVKKWRALNQKKRAGKK